MAGERKWVGIQIMVKVATSLLTFKQLEWGVNGAPRGREGWKSFAEIKGRVINSGIWLRDWGQVADGEGESSEAQENAGDRMIGIVSRVVTFGCVIDNAGTGGVCSRRVFEDHWSEWRNKQRFREWDRRGP